MIARRWRLPVAVVAALTIAEGAVFALRPAQDLYRVRVPGVEPFGRPSSSALATMPAVSGSSGWRHRRPRALVLVLPCWSARGAASLAGPGAPRSPEAARTLAASLPRFRSPPRHQRAVHDGS